MFLLASKKGYMNYDQFTQISRNRLSSPVKNLSSDSDEIEKSPPALSSSRLNPHRASLVKNLSLGNSSHSRKVKIFDSPEMNRRPQHCFKKVATGKCPESVEIIKEGLSCPKNRIVRNGFGVQIFRDGSKFKGHFKKDLAHGRGELLYTNGTKVIGKWRRNNLESASILYESGAIFKGSFQGLLNERGVVSGESFKRGRFYFTDGRYFEGIWSKRGALKSGFVYEDQFKCFRLRTDDLPFVFMSKHQAGMGAIINRRWIYEGQVSKGRMDGQGWIYEPFNCSYIRTDWDLNALGRDFEFRYINLDNFYKKEFESSGGKIRKIRVFQPTGLVFEKDFDQKKENFGILRLMFEDLAGVFQGKVDSCENIRVFDGEYVHDHLRLPLKIFFDQEKELIFLLEENLMDIKGLKQHIAGLASQTPPNPVNPVDTPIEDSFKMVTASEEVERDGDTREPVDERIPEEPKPESEPEVEVEAKSFSESTHSESTEQEEAGDVRQGGERPKPSEIDVTKSVQKVMEQIDTKLIEKITQNMEKLDSDLNQLDDFSESFTSEKASVVSDTANTVKPLLQKPPTEEDSGEENEETRSETNQAQNANSSFNISMISEIEAPPLDSEELKLQIQGLDLISSQFDKLSHDEPSFQDKEETPLPVQETSPEEEQAEEADLAESKEESVEIIEHEPVKTPANEVSSLFTSFTSKASGNQSFNNAFSVQTPQKESNEMKNISFDDELFDLEMEEIESEDKEHPELLKGNSEHAGKEKKGKFEDSFELFDD